MHVFLSALSVLATASAVNAARATQVQLPGFSNCYSDYRGKSAPYPGNLTRPILPTKNGTTAPDDQLWQNLLAAEWNIFSFYQQAIDRFNASSFTALGFPNTTYDRIQEIRDNEAGHLKIFMDQISENSVKPGPCKYDYGDLTPEAFVITETLIEIAAMVFLTGLVQQAKTVGTAGALSAVAETETRHETWLLIDLWKTNPFAGPADTSYPYPNQIMDSSNQFIVPGSCPRENPHFPTPSQNLPRITYRKSTNSSLTSNTEVEFVFLSDPPVWRYDQQYYAVFFHEVSNITMPFDTQRNTSTIPDFDLNKGVIVAVITDTPGAPTEESCVAGPVFLVEQPTGAIKLGGAA